MAFIWSGADEPDVLFIEEEETAQNVTATLSVAAEDPLALPVESISYSLSEVLPDSITVTSNGVDSITVTCAHLGGFIPYVVKSVNVDTLEITVLQSSFDIPEGDKLFSYVKSSQSPYDVILTAEASDGVVTESNAYTIRIVGDYTIGKLLLLSKL